MNIVLEGISKRYDREWILHSVDLELKTGNCYGISGRNGSGKSTLLRILSGHLSPSRGRVVFSDDRGQKLEAPEIYEQLSFVGPYIDLIEELSLDEAIRFHFQFKQLRPGIELEEIVRLMELTPHRRRPLRQFSSGMKQRVLLGLAFYSATNLLLLDEPTTTLDEIGKQWYQEQLRAHREGRLVVIASNLEEDLQQCQQLLDVGSMKPIPKS